MDLKQELEQEGAEIPVKQKGGKKKDKPLFDDGDTGNGEEGVENSSLQVVPPVSVSAVKPKIERRNHRGTLC